MKKTIQLIKDFLEKDGWNYSYDDEKCLFVTGVNMNNALGSLDILIRVRETSYTVYAVLNSHAEKKYIHLVAEYLHRVNYGLINGNFELDCDDGEVRYKTYVDFKNIIINEEIVRTSIIVPVFMYDEYGKNLMKVMVGYENPKQLIEEIENSEEDE